MTGRPSPAVSRLFDLRWPIAALLGLYGAVCLVLGIFAPEEDIARADGININLWSGLGMLAVSAMFVTWARLRPLALPSQDEIADAAGTGQLPEADR